MKRQDSTDELMLLGCSSKVAAGADPGAAEADAHRQKVEQLLDGGVQVFHNQWQPDADIPGAIRNN